MWKGVVKFSGRASRNKIVNFILPINTADISGIFKIGVIFGGHSKLNFRQPYLGDNMVNIR